MIGTTCVSCGRLKPQMATGIGETEGGRKFRYIESPHCASCRHADPKPGKLKSVAASRRGPQLFAHFEPRSA